MEYIRLGSTGMKVSRICHVRVAVSESAARDRTAWVGALRLDAG
jgi:hypothetical protein